MDNILAYLNSLSEFNYEGSNQSQRSTASPTQIAKSVPWLSLTDWNKDRKSWIHKGANPQLKVARLQGDLLRLFTHLTFPFRCDWKPIGRVQRGKCLRLSANNTLKLYHRIECAVSPMRETRTPDSLPFSDSISETLSVSTSDRTEINHQNFYKQ